MQSFFLIISLLLNPYKGNKVAHDFHISRCEINYETTSGDVQISAHIFIDDLEDAIKGTNKKQAYIGTSKEIADCDLMIESYIKNKLKISSGNKQLSYSILGKEVTADKLAVWCHFEVLGIKNIKSLHVTNTILTEIYNDQKNIVDFTVDNKKKGFTIFNTTTFTNKFEW